jgi:3-oxoacyl-[acyl-carrier protein] reductase
MTLQGKVAVVTGGAGALGLAAVRALLEDGAKVALMDLDALRLDTLSRFLRGERIIVAGDVTDASAVRAAHERVRAELGPVDVLVNAAGASCEAALAATDDAAWRRVMGVRVTGSFLWSRAAFPEMASRGWGRIVNVAGAGSATAPGGSADAAAAGAIAALTASLAREGAARGVTVNAVAPSFVGAPSSTAHLAEPQVRQVLSAIPAGRFGEPEEFAHVVRFLASPLAGFVTGQTIRLDGGRHLA